jgi:Pyridoxamine 5'-phosphate oxidase
MEVTLGAMRDSWPISAIRRYLERYANSKYWVDFEYFAFYRMEVVDVYYVGGFGVMGWVAAQDYDRGEARSAGGHRARHHSAHEHGHADALVLLARKICGRRVPGSGDYGGGPPRVSRAGENGGRRAWGAHRISTGSAQPHGRQRGAAGNGGEGAGG